MGLLAGPAHADEATLQAEVQALRAQVADQAARLQKLEALLSARPRAAPTTAASAPTPAAPEPVQTVASLTEPEAPATVLGGYGEISYNAYLKDSSRNQADLKRFVLSLSHSFNDRLSFNGEVEVEHAVSSAEDQGEIEIEQAWLSYRLNSRANLKAGLFLIPAGLLNRNHEPPVFYGVERNEVETRIIPSTWREGGVGLYGSLPAGFDYDVGVTTGFDSTGLDDASAPLAGSHQELQLAHAKDLSVYGSLDWKGVPGLLLGGSVFSGNTTQGNARHKADPAEPDFAGAGGGRMTLWDVHGRWQGSGFDLEALYARGHFADAAAIDQTLLDYNAASGEDRPLVPKAFYGWLVQGAYTLPLGGEAAVSPFVRYERYDTQADMPLGLSGDPANRDKVLTLGASLKPIPEIVVKADYQTFLDHPDNDRINLGVGYMF